MKPFLVVFLLLSITSSFSQGIPVNKKTPKPPLGKINGFTFFEDSSENGFYVKNIEVTIGEYFEFVDWVIDSCARRVLADEFPEEFLIHPCPENCGYDGEPDEEDWILTEVKYSWDDEEYYPLLISAFALPENQRFYKSKKFDSEKIIYQKDSLLTEVIPKDFAYYIDVTCKKNRFRESLPQEIVEKPIYNISYSQALAFCLWKTEQLNNSSKKLEYECFIPKATHLAFIIRRNYVYSKNWLQVYPDELECKLEYENNRLLDSFRRALPNYKGYMSNGSYLSRDKTSGVYLAPQKEYINPAQEKFDRRFKTTKDYYSYDNEKTFLGMYDNVSEWIDYPLLMNDSNLKERLIEYKDKNLFLGDIRNATLVYGGNWWHGKDEKAITYIDKEQQLETIGFRYVITVTRKKYH